MDLPPPPATGTSAAAGAPPTAPSSRTVPKTIDEVSVLLATQGVDAMSQTLQFIMSARRFVWLSTEEKANLIKEVLLGNPRVEELIATQIMRGQILSQRFWEPKAAYYGSDEEDEDEDDGNKVAVDSAEIEDLLKEHKLVSKRKGRKEEWEDSDNDDEEESDDDDDDEEEEEGEGKGGKKASRAVALCAEVNALLLKAGIKDPDRTSKCMRAGLAKGYYGKFTGEAEELDKVVWTGSCLTCRKTLKATARQLLKQPDYAGLDYEEGGSCAVIRCSEDCDGLYVTSMCNGKPESDNGKSHNHCRACPGLGKCLRDYREEHCDDCGEHYFAGMSGFPCPCSKEKQMLTKARAGDRHALAALFFRVSNPFGAEDDEADMMGAMGEGGGQENCVVM